MAIITQIGLGIIGGTWARAHAEDGVHTVRAWNRTPQPDVPGFTSDLQQAVTGADFIHICLAGPPSVQSILDQILPVLKTGALVIQSSTISPAAAASFSQQVQAVGADYLEAPFTGSKPAAQSRQLVFFAGGDETARQRASLILNRLGRKTIAFATPAQAAAIKLAMNLQIAAISHAMAEGLALAQHHGLDAKQFFEVLDLNVSRSGLVDLKKDKIIAGDYSPQFSIKHMGKDLHLALAAAGATTPKIDGAAALPLPLTQRVAALYDQAIDAGLAELDFIALQKLLHTGNDVT